MSDMKLSTPGFDMQALSQSGALNKTGATATTKSGSQGKGVDQAAQEFEAVFLSQMLTHMWEGVQSDETFGGGEAENTWRSMMIDEYGKQIAKSGGVGIADEIKAEMLRMQEEASKTGKGGR